MSRDKIFAELRRNRDRMRSEFLAEIVGIFGSYARGDQRKDSDIDVLVDFDDGANIIHLCGLGFFLEDLLGCKVDIVPRRSLRREIAPYVMADLVRL